MADIGTATAWSAGRFDVVANPDAIVLIDNDADFELRVAEDDVEHVVGLLMQAHKAWKAVYA